MMISKDLAKSHEFSLKHSLISDGDWKRKLLVAQKILFINQPIINFYLDGASSTKPNKILLLEIIKIKTFLFLGNLYFS